MTQNSAASPVLTAPESGAEPFLNLQRCYLKGLSVEMPHAPKIFLEQGQLSMDLNITLAHSELDTGIIEVVVRGTLTAKLGGRVAYLIEAEQAGIFQMANVPVEHLGGIVNVTCPNLIYPYLRALVADAIARTGLPVFHLPEVNFAAMFTQSAQAQTLATMPVVGTVQ